MFTCIITSGDGMTRDLCDNGPGQRTLRTWSIMSPAWWHFWRQKLMEMKSTPPAISPPPPGETSSQGLRKPNLNDDNQQNRKGGVSESVCVCVCVRKHACVWERENERKENKERERETPKGGEKACRPESYFSRVDCSATWWWNAVNRGGGKIGHTYPASGFILPHVIT